MDWLPIETAPVPNGGECGPLILVYVPTPNEDFRVLVARHWGIWQTVGGEDISIEPTHWAPLPAGPGRSDD